ncbi:MAG: hypothetical protein ACXWV0_05040 [Flavisolibacter sp.]
MKFKISILFLVLFSAFAAQAQLKGETKFNIRYNVGVPAGSFKEQLSETSFRGLNGSILYGLTDKLSIGFATGFQDFYQKTPRQLYKLEDGSDLSAVRTHSIQSIPLLVQTKYQFSQGKAIQPYVALAAGGNIISYADMLGEFVNEQDAAFGFVARPEAGVLIPFGKTKSSGITLGATYNFMPFKAGAFTNMNHIGLHAGVSIPMRK